MTKLPPLPVCRPQPYRSLKEVEETSGSAVDSLDPSAIGNITIPRPQGRKTPELGAVLAPPAVQSRSKAVGSREGRAAPGREEFRQALSMSSEGQQALEDSADLIRLLDPLNSPPPFPLHHPHVSLNPFAQSVQHYSPSVCGNPFSVAYGPPPASFMHTSFSALPGIHRQLSPCSSSHGLAQTAAASLPQTSDSSHALSSPLDAAMKPLQAQGPAQKAKDPFGDLLSMATPVLPQKKKAEDPRRKWETFD
uniref:Uncharacterized protein n=1 Tax=Cyprinodon variegatus TaxID=28743 RepID=A0A3Q2E009_CYPVA